MTYIDRFAEHRILRSMPQHAESSESRGERMGLVAGSTASSAWQQLVASARVVGMELTRADDL